MRLLAAKGAAFPTVSCPRAPSALVLFIRAA
jgi:hypothetical protein